MKRVTILVDADRGVDSEGDRRFAVPIAGLNDSEFYVRADRVLSVEEHVEPLPTEPGFRFWGKAPGLGDQYAAQWWFVRQNGAGVVFYAPTRTDQIGIGISAADVERVGLVRLPDPDGAA